MIDREKAITGLGCLADENSACHSDCPYFTDREDGGFCFRKMAHDALELLKEQPEQKHGHWIPAKQPIGVEAFGYKEYTAQEVTCSECRFTEDVMASAYLYCPNCGARMDEEMNRDV